MAGVAGRAGGDYEWTITRYGQDSGLPWDKSPPRGRRDLLDILGTLPAGYLVGTKAIRRDTPFGQKISEAMDQCDRALVNLGRPYEKDGKGRLIVDCGGIVPVQVMQRSGYPVGKHYVVTQLDYWLAEVVERAKGRAEQ